MKITFLGATEEVTGSCYLIQTDSATVLLECGQKQGSRKQEHENANAFSFDITTLDAVIISHAHIDHSGRLPLLIKQNYSGPIYTHMATRALLEIMLLDSAYLHEKDAEWENKRLQKKFKAKKIPNFNPVNALFTKEDVGNTIPLINGIDYSERIEIADKLFVAFQDAGHILGSGIVEVWDENSTPSKKLVFSGDLGYSDAPVMQDPKTVPDADMVMMESTYGDRPHKIDDDTLDELKNIFKQAAIDGGNVLIPSFAVGRTQDLLYLMSKNFSDWGLDNWQIFLDSPMAIRVTEVYGRFHDMYEAKIFDTVKHEPLLPNLTMSMSTEDSMQVNTIRSGAIIIAGSGMCNGGRIHHHLKYNISKENTHIIFVGYQAYGTLGRMIVDGVDEIKLWGEQYKVRANIHTIGGLSAHADQDGLIAWYSGFDKKPPLYLVHGEPKAQAVLQARIREELVIDAKIAKYGETVYV